MHNIIHGCCTLSCPSPAPVRGRTYLWQDGGEELVDVSGHEAELDHEAEEKTSEAETKHPLQEGSEPQAAGKGEANLKHIST